MKEQLEEQIRQLHYEIAEYASMKERKIINVREFDIVIAAINDELYHLYRSSIMM